MDFAFANDTTKHSNTISVSLSNGDGTFGIHTDYAVGQSPWGLAAADLNGDNKLDLIAANSNDNTISVLLNSGQGHFAEDR